MKSELRNVLWILTAVYSNWNHTEQGAIDDICEEDDGLTQHGFSSNFLDFCQGDLPILYMNCTWVKFDLLASALVTMPADAQQSGSFKMKIYIAQNIKKTSLSRAARRERAIADALTKTNSHHWLKR